MENLYKTKDKYIQFKKTNFKFKILYVKHYSYVFKEILIFSKPILS